MKAWSKVVLVKMAGTDLDSPNMSRYCFCPTKVCVIIRELLLHWSYFPALGSISSLPHTLDLILALPSSDSFLLRLLDDFRILHCLVFDKGTEHPILILTAFTWMACTLHHLLCFLFHKKQDICFIDISIACCLQSGTWQLWLMRWSLHALGLAVMACIFQLWKVSSCRS